MGYVINSEGEKMEVKNPNGCCGENVVLINDTTILNEKWIIAIYKKAFYGKNSESESDFITEIILDEEPTNEEIIFYMVTNGVNRYSGYSIVERIRVLDFEEEDD